jgi:hypothetical protein
MNIQLALHIHELYTEMWTNRQSMCHIFKNKIALKFKEPTAIHYPDFWSFGGEVAETAFCVSSSP